MIIIDKPRLKFLLAGRQIDVQVSREYRKGRVYGIGIRPKRTICRAIILNATETSDGWTITIRQQTDDKPVYLAANPGAIRADYTLNPARAARETDGSPIEAATGKRGSKWFAYVVEQIHEHDDQARREAAHRARLRRQGRNLSVSRLKWAAAPPASDIQAAGPAGNSSATPESEAA